MERNEKMSFLRKLSQRAEKIVNLLNKMSVKPKKEIA